MTTPNTDWLDEVFYNCLPTYAVEQQHLDQLKQAILLHEQQARIDELTWFRGYNHKVMSEIVWDNLNNRIATLTQQTSQGVSDER